ncbi:MAG: PH domain-containing protein [Candidatus Heimdallarchaeota archaeon]|nr:PH domain-containing protein [Candidatus Heimdallarchaeota archaeon]
MSVEIGFLKPDRNLLKKYNTIAFIMSSIYVLVLIIPLLIIDLAINVEVFDFISPKGWIIIGAVIGPVYLIGLSLAFIINKKRYEAIEYHISAKSILVQGGFSIRSKTTIPLDNVTNVVTIQGPWDRRFGIGSVIIQTAAASGSNVGVRLVGLANFEEIANQFQILMEKQ